MSKRPKNKELSVKVTRAGVLTIEIGIETLANATLHSDYVYSLMGPSQERPDTRFLISNARGFAAEIKRALVDEIGEDGHSILTCALDDAAEKAIEGGSEFFTDSEDER